jgi:hypothetical protein
MTNTNDIEVIEPEIVMPEIKLKFGRYLINDKTVDKLNYYELDFFSEFLIAMRLIENPMKIVKTMNIL